jgi:hypothetical protein
MGLCKVIASMPEFSLSCSGAHGGMARQRRLIWHPALDNGFHKSMGSKYPLRSIATCYCMRYLTCGTTLKYKRNMRRP